MDPEYGPFAVVQVVAVGRTPDEAWADAALKQMIAKVHQII